MTDAVRDVGLSSRAMAGQDMVWSPFDRCRVMGGDVVLRTSNSTIRRVLEVTGLSKVFAITRDNTSATDADPTAGLECSEVAESQRRLGFGHRRR